MIILKHFTHFIKSIFSSLLFFSAFSPLKLLPVWNISVIIYLSLMSLPEHCQFLFHLFMLPWTLFLNSEICACLLSYLVHSNMFSHTFNLLCLVANFLRSGGGGSWCGWLFFIWLSFSWFFHLCSFSMLFHDAKCSLGIFNHQLQLLSLLCQQGMVWFTS